MSVPRTRFGRLRVRLFQCWPLGHRWMLSGRHPIFQKPTTDVVCARCGLVKS